MNCERFTVITRDLYAYALPHALKPGFWVAPVTPNVHGYPLTPQQVRTDDYQRPAGEYRLECKLSAATESQLIEKAEQCGLYVRQALYLQRGSWGILQLLDGSEIDLKPDSSDSRKGILGVSMVALDRRWFRPDGSVILGER